MKEYVFDKLDVIKNHLRGKHILLFLDFDGTLTPIMDTPKKAVLSCRAKDLLRKLAVLFGASLVVISGRSLKDIKSRIGIKKIVYVGNHGLEIEGPGLRAVFPVSKPVREMMRKIRAGLTRRLRDIRGVLVEDKGLTLSIHYRLVKMRDVHRVRDRVKEQTENYVVRKKLQLAAGKKVIEIKPYDSRDKGKFVTEYLRKRKRLFPKEKIQPVYIGDDTTDEDAFNALRKNGLGIVVTSKKKKSFARYYVKDVNEVNRFLGFLVKLKQDSALCRT